MGFDLIVVVPLLPSHYGFSLVFGVFFFFFLVSSSVLLLMVVQQLVAISVLSQEEMITCPLHHEHMSFYSRLAILSQSWKIYFKWELLSLFCFFSSSMSSSFSLLLLIFAFISG